MNKLRAYQKEGVERLIELTDLRGGAILADEPGLGKTIQVAEYINRVRPAKVLIVCPASLRLNWEYELNKWLTVKPQSLDIVSYEGVNAGKAPMLGLDLAVFDEAHYLKNPTAKRTAACFSIMAKRRLFLTGTPIVNRPIEIYPILKAMGCKMTRNQFGKRYCDGHLTQIHWNPKRYAWDFSGASHVDELNAQLRENVMVRRTKAEVLTELPAKIRQVVEVDAPHGERSSFRDAMLRYFNSLTDAAGNIGELKRIAFEELSKVRLENALHKLPYVLNFIEDLLGEEDKLVVFAHHREIIDEIADKVSVGAVKLYGGMPDTIKDRSVKEFQTGQSRVFVGQIQAAGTGITLTAAHTVVFAEVDWVPGNIIQAEDRCHRMGQTDTVRVFHLVLKDSMDGRMVRALVDKQRVIEEAMR